MNKNLRISIPEPCHEDWNRMTPAEKGRYCGSCQKVVMDFTSMSDAQIIAYFKKAGENTCGRFYNDQLNREIQTPRKRLPWVKYFFQVAIPALLFSYRAVAQGKPVKVDTVNIIQALEGKIGWIGTDKEHEEKNDAEGYKVTGRVLDPSGQGIPFATVANNKNKIAVQADANGIFMITLKGPGDRLTVSALGFVSQTIDIDKKKTATITMVKVEEELYGVVVTVSSPNEEKWPFFSSKGLYPYGRLRNETYLAAGRVINEEGEPLEAASILVKESGKGAITNQEGEFEFVTGKRKKYTLEVSSIGYQTLTIKMKGNSDDDIVLKRKDSLLQEVVVTAPSGTIKKTMTTGGTSAVTNCTIRKTSLWDRIFGDPQQSFMLYPNPVQAFSELKVEWKMEPGEFKWEIMDMAGRSVKSGLASISAKSQTVIIDLPAAPAGTYILRFTDKKGKSYSGKFIVRP